MISEAKPRAPRILIARFSALGDIVTMQPLVTAMRRRFGEDAVLDLVCLSRCAEAANLLSEINQVHVVERGTGEVLEALRERNFDYLMDFHGNVRSRSLARSLDVLTFTVDKQAWNRWQLIKVFGRPPVTRASSNAASNASSLLMLSCLRKNVGDRTLGVISTFLATETLLSSPADKL